MDVGGDMTGIVCAPKVYHYKYVTFEFHPYYGPRPLRKDGEPRKVIPKSFWAVWEEFSKLSEQEKEFYRIGGGCTIV